MICLDLRLTFFFFGFLSSLAGVLTTRHDTYLSVLFPANLLPGRRC
jgi:hypothetical protein